MKRVLGMISIVLGAVLVSLALLLFIHNQEDDRKAGGDSDIVLGQVKETLKDIENPFNSFFDPETGLPSDEMKTVEIDGYEYIGYLSIPTLELELPVMSEWDYARLKIAPCRQFGSTKSDDLVIAGHNYKMHFGRLSNLKIGDLIQFTDMDNANNYYLVDCVDVIQPNVVDKIQNSEWDLVLYTCTYGGQKRVMVGCQRMTKEMLEIIN